MNAVRKHLSAVKGGRLAVAAAPARLLTLAISDVPGDDPDVIGSGPTVPDASTLADAKTVLAHYGIEPAPSIQARSECARGRNAETRRSHAFERATFHMIATPQASLEAAREYCRLQAGLAAPILSDRIEGEARDVAKVLGAVALASSATGDPFASPAVLLSGGGDDGDRAGRWARRVAMLSFCWRSRLRWMGQTGFLPSPAIQTA